MRQSRTVRRHEARATRLLALGLLASKAAATGAGFATTGELSPPSPPQRLRSEEVNLEISVAAPADPKWDQSFRCSDLEDVLLLGLGFACGSPLTRPCFDYERCSTSSGIYVHDAECSLSASSAMLNADGTGFGLEKTDNYHYIGWVFRNAAREAGVLAESYESACLVMDVRRKGSSCALRSPLWNNGTNHVMVDLGDYGREERSKIADSFAMDAASNIHSCVYRSGYDVALPITPQTKFHHLAAIAPSDRAFFLTAKGSVYLGRHGTQERQSIVPLQDEKHGVVMSMHCFELHGEHLLPENVDYCQSLKSRYDDYEYGALMNTTFGLVPAGRSPGTYRLGEVMSAGAIPVIVARDIVLPFREQFDWPSFSFTFAPEEVGMDLMDTLRAVPKAQLDEMQRLSLEAYRGMFGDDDTLTGPAAFGPVARRLIDVVVHRVQHRGGR